MADSSLNGRKYIKREFSLLVVISQDLNCRYVKTRVKCKGVLPFVPQLKKSRRHSPIWVRDDIRVSVNIVCIKESHLVG